MAVEELDEPLPDRPGRAEDDDRYPSVSPHTRLPTLPFASRRPHDAPRNLDDVGERPGRRHLGPRARPRDDQRVLRVPSRAEHENVLRTRQTPQRRIDRDLPERCRAAAIDRRDVTPPRPPP